MRSGPPSSSGNFSSPYYIHCIQYNTDRWWHWHAVVNFHLFSSCGRTSCWKTAQRVPESEPRCVEVIWKSGRRRMRNLFHPLAINVNLLVLSCGIPPRLRGPIGGQELVPRLQGPPERLTFPSDTTSVIPRAHPHLISFHTLT